MSDSSQFSVDSSGLAQVSGPLTLDTVAAVFHQARAEAARGRQIVALDLDGVSRVDSSGLALLLEWQSTAVRDGRGISIRNAPRDLLSLSSLCEASGLLTIEGRNHTGKAKAAHSHAHQDTSL
jgi:phospholipid transport system transporter-binding protein